MFAPREWQFLASSTALLFGLIALFISWGALEVNFFGTFERDYHLFFAEDSFNGEQADERTYYWSQETDDGFLYLRAGSVATVAAILTTAAACFATFQLPRRGKTQFWLAMSAAFLWALGLGLFVQGMRVNADEFAIDLGGGNLLAFLAVILLVLGAAARRFVPLRAERFLAGRGYQE